jgi:hypothetical protein
MKRRILLQQTAAAIVATTATSAKHLRAVGDNPNNKIRIGMMGTHGRAGFLMRAFAAQKDVEMVGLAEVDTRKHIAAMKTVTSVAGGSPYITSDYRHLIDDKSIDAIVVGTPDHWHAIPTIQACQAGKDVYVEKPDGHNMLEGQRMVQAGAKYHRIIQWALSLALVLISKKPWNGFHAESLVKFSLQKLGKAPNSQILAHHRTLNRQQASTIICGLAPPHRARLMFAGFTEIGVGF